MFIIWGFGKVTGKKYAFNNSYYCPRCHNTVQTILVKATTWFTLFFIPTIPYRKEYFFECPICGNAQMVTKQHFEALVNPQNMIGQ